MTALENKKYHLLLPLLIYLNLFVTFPTLYTWYMSVMDYGLSGQRFIGLRNYVGIVQDETFRRVFLNTFYLVIVAVLLQLLVGFVIALVLNQNFFGKSFVYWVVLLPMVIPPVVVGMVFRVLYDPSLGLINYILKLFHLNGPEWLTNPKLSMFSIILIDTWQWTPFMALLLLSGLQYVPQEVKESAMVDGASVLQSFRYITLPLMKNITALALIFRTLDCFNKTFDVIYMTTRGGPGYTTEIIPTLVYRSAFQYLKFGKAAAQSIVLFFTIAIFIALLRRVSKEELITN